MKRLFFLIILLVTTISCKNVSFLYSEKNITSELFYNKTELVIRGIDLQVFNRVLNERFGDPISSKYSLDVYTSETITKKSVETNQVVSKLDYEIRFNYKLYLIEKNCQILNKQIYSNFSFSPKSSGYDFGSDKSLENLYELAAKDNLDKFFNYLRGKESELNCSDEA